METLSVTSATSRYEFFLSPLIKPCKVAWGLQLLLLFGLFMQLEEHVLVLHLTDRCFQVFLEDKTHKDFALFLT